jgi:hypothetical protein
MSVSGMLRSTECTAFVTVETMLDGFVAERTTSVIGKDLHTAIAGADSWPTGK